MGDLFSLKKTVWKERNVDVRRKKIVATHSLVLKLDAKSTVFPYTLLYSLILIGFRNLFRIKPAQYIVNGNFMLIHRY